LKDLQGVTGVREIVEVVTGPFSTWKVVASFAFQGQQYTTRPTEKSNTTSAVWRYFDTDWNFLTGIFVLTGLFLLVFLY
jgi:hypothetical protein